MTMRDRMEKGLLFTDICDGLPQRRADAKNLMKAFNETDHNDMETRQKILSQMLCCGKNVCIEPPFYFIYGKNITLGDGSFINMNCNFIDDGKIIIGKKVLIGPAVTVVTVGHPVNPRMREYMYTDPVVIEDNVWIGAGVTICPGVTIGENSVIGAGSVVTKAANLENGATYVIFYAGGSNNNQEQPYCWQVDGNGVVSRQNASDKNASFSRNRVFKFHKTSTLNGSWTSNGQDYRSASSGYLEAMYRNRYMVKSGSNLDFTATSTSGAVDLRFGNSWANETGSDIDVWVSTSETIYWTGYYLYWGGTGNTPRKWFFYKVVEN